VAKQPAVQSGIDACAEAGPTLSAKQAMHSGNPAFDALPGYFMRRLEPTLGALLETAARTGEIRADVSAKDLLNAIALLCQPIRGEEFTYNQRMAGVLIDGPHRPP
jgi:hypothetical protein